MKRAKTHAHTLTAVKRRSNEIKIKERKIGGNIEEKIRLQRFKSTAKEDLVVQTHAERWWRRRRNSIFLHLFALCSENTIRQHETKLNLTAWENRKRDEKKIILNEQPRKSKMMNRPKLMIWKKMNFECQCRVKVTNECQLNRPKWRANDVRRTFAIKDCNKMTRTNAPRLWLSCVKIYDIN